MAFFGKLGNILRQTTNRKFVSELRPSPSVFQAIRCMCSGPTTKLFIGGVSYSTDEQSLREAFSRYGEVLDARIIMDRETGRSRGFGFITFTSVEEASSAIQALDGQDLHGRRVRVNYANERPRGFGGGGGGFGGGYGGGGSFGGGGGYGGGGHVHGGYGGGEYGGSNSRPGDNYGGHGATNNYSAPGSFETSNAPSYGNEGSNGNGSGDAGIGTDSAGGYDRSGGVEYDNVNKGGVGDSVEGNYRDDNDDFAKRA